MTESELAAFKKGMFFQDNLKIDGGRLALVL